MKNLGQRYVQYGNRTYRRSGTLWEGRFRSCLIQSEGYMLACYRYIESNPVRAGMVRHPRDYRWSSYRTNAEGKINELVVPHSEYAALGRNASVRQGAYRELFRNQIDENLIKEIRSMTNSGFVLGNSRFQEQISRALGQRVTRGKAGRPKKIERK